jgi:hypothetical protein
VGAGFAKKDMHKQEAGQAMADNNPKNGTSSGTIGLMLGGLFALAAMVFILTGGQLGGVKVVNSDSDLPPVASPEKKN